jgi:lycopene beta-cyclase
LENQIQTSYLDYLFAGAGASAILLLMSLDERGLLDGKNIVIIDPDTKLKNDKTYCFWENSDDLIVKRCQHLISHQWEKVRVNSNKPQLLDPMKYFYISSFDLYKELQRIIEKHNILRIHQSVLNLKKMEDDGVAANTTIETFLSKIVFDSRPPYYLNLKKNESHLLQSFLGYVIEVENKIPDYNCVDLMDFDVEQNESTQFVYILPFSENKLLVELTRFGVSQLKQKEAEPILDKYITKRFGKYKIVAIEIGNIPMSNADILTDKIPHVISIGGRSGAIKPSTGYAFKNMFKHAENIASKLQNNFTIEAINKVNRFKFYDRLLLLILRNDPPSGKKIFETLFKKNNAKNVLKFMDEKTSLIQDIKILSTLPFKPFLKAWKLDILVKYRSFAIPFLLITIALGLFFFNSFFPNHYKWIESVLFLLGLISVGIPHGAVDHLLESGNLHSKIKLNFVIRYLGAAFIYFILWLLFPNIALLFFLIYSIWHFGQADIKEWKIQNYITYKNWIWGGMLMGIILYGHSSETNLILKNMGVELFHINEKTGKLISFSLAFFAFIWGIWERKLAMVLSCVFLAISIQLPLITSFGLYFIGQHSIHGWSHLRKGLNVNNTSLYLKALPFTIGAFLLFFILFIFIDKKILTEFESQIIISFFIFTSCISFPHVLTMNVFYKKTFKSK